jgi:hypothetical protein
MRLYFVHLSQRLGYVGDEKHAELESLFRRTFACLIGLIPAVEKESGIVLGLAQILRPSLSP